MDRAYILLSIQGALVGEIDPCMKAIGVDFAEKHFRITVYVDSSSNKEIEEDFDASVMTQIFADFSQNDLDEGWGASYKFVEAKEPLPPTDEWVFAIKGMRFQS